MFHVSSLKPTFLVIVTVFLKILVIKLKNMDYLRDTRISFVGYTFRQYLSTITSVHRNENMSVSGMEAMCVTDIVLYITRNNF